MADFVGKNALEDACRCRIVLRFESLRGEYRPLEPRGFYGPAVTFTIGGSGCRLSSCDIVRHIVSFPS